MSEVRLLIRELDRDWSGIVNAIRAETAVAALSANPVTLGELDIAVLRFVKPTAKQRYLAALSEGFCENPHDAGLVIIDLIARLIVVDTALFTIEHDCAVEYQVGEKSTELVLRYHLADDWLILTDKSGWQKTAEERRRERKSDLDARPIFYGRSMLEFIARECFAAFVRREEIEAAVRAEWAAQSYEPNKKDNPFADTIKQIHAAWLLTPREDLAGACPREIAVSRRNHLTWDMQDRCEQWSRLRACPRGLDESSHAFKYAGFDVHELVLYYELIREILWSCWAQLNSTAKSPGTPLILEDFLAAEIPRLDKIKETWLDTPNEDCRGKTPRSVIKRERARIAEYRSASDAIHDKDCPCCQMLEEMGPGFWHLDGCNMDDEFAFDFYVNTRKDWDDKIRSHEEFNKRFEAEQEECEKLGVQYSARNGDGAWSRKLSRGDAEVPIGIRLFEVGCRLASVIVALRAGLDKESVPPEAQRHIDRLNRDFGNFRELLQSKDGALSEALIEPVMQHFREALDNVAADRPDIDEKCAEIKEDLQNFLNPPAPEPVWDSEDSEFPGEPDNSM